MEDILEVLFGDYKKVIAWAIAATLMVFVMSLSSCVVDTSVSGDAAETNRVKIKGHSLITLSEQGHNPVLVNCAVNGWANSKNRTSVCLEAVRASGDLKALTREELESLLKNTKIITGGIAE